MSASKGVGEVRGNPLFSNTGGDKRKIRPPSFEPAAEQPIAQDPEPAPASRAASQPAATSPDAVRKPPPPRERGEVPFDEFYSKKTVHFIPILLDQFQALARKQHKSQTRLLNEAIASILDQYGALDEKTRRVLEEFGITTPEE